MATNEVQSFYLVGSDDMLGAVRFEYGGKSAIMGIDDLTTDATGAKLLALLEGMSSIGSGNINIDSPWTKDADSHIWRATVSFKGTLAATNLNQLCCTGQGLLFSPRGAAVRADCGTVTQGAA